MNYKLSLLLTFLLIMSKVDAQQNLRHAFQSPTVVNKIPYGANAKAGHYVQAKDAKIYYEVYGKGQPIVLLHGGLFGSTIEMTHFMNRLKSYPKTTRRKS